MSDLYSLRKIDESIVDMIDDLMQIRIAAKEYASSLNEKTADMMIDKVDSLPDKIETLKNRFEDFKVHLANVVKEANGEEIEVEGEQTENGVILS